MKIDNSMARAFWDCPLKWKERYGNNLEPRERSSDALEFGTRMHVLLEERHRSFKGESFEPAAPVRGDLEAEAQLTFAAYEAHYPEEPFEVVGVEKYFEVPLPPVRYKEFTPAYIPNIAATVNLVAYQHIYCGEFDAICRMKDSGRLWLLETKTEKRGGKSNHPKSWQQKSQVSLYLWAAQQIYGEEFEGVMLNVITRQSPKGQERPSFRRDHLERTRKQQAEAVKNLVWVADRIEECQRTGFFPADRNECVSDWGWECEYLKLHQNEERLADELVQIYYKPAEPYLSGL